MFGLRLARLACVLILVGSASSAVLAEGEAGAAIAKTSSLGEIKKEHGVAGPDGRSSVRIIVPADVVGLKDASVGCVLFFTDASGAALRSPLAAYNDSSGSMRAVSPDTKVEADPDGIDFSYVIPYAAFPKLPAGKYEVEVRARLVLRSTTGKSLLATAQTKFWVEG